MNSQLSASSLALMTVNDPQFRLPVRPCLVPGLVLQWTTEGLVVEGTGNRRTLTGRTTRQILPDLLPLLDGTRDLDELAALVRWSPGPLRSILLLLYSCGMLQEGPEPEGGPIDPRYALFARLLDTTRVNVSATEAMVRLSRAAVAVAAAGPFRDLLLSQMAENGMRVLESPDHVAAEIAAGTVELGEALVIVDVSSLGPSQARRTSRRLFSAGVPVLFVGAQGVNPFIGPYSAPDLGACGDCLLTDVLVTGSVTGIAAEILAAQAVIEATCLIARVGTSSTLHGRQTFRLDGGGTTSDFAGSQPGCRVCGDPHVEPQAAPLALQYEQSVAFPPRRLVNPRDHQHHFESANVELQYDEKPPPAEVVELPGGSARDAVESVPRHRSPRAVVTVEDLAAVLAAGFGLKRPPVVGEKLARWAPTGGNLGSPLAYLIVRDVEGLDPGYYSYVPTRHGLGVLGRRAEPDGPTGPAVDIPPPLAAPGSDPDHDLGRVDLVVAGAFARVARKYRSFAYRVVHLDTGVALSHVAITAGRLGLPIRLAHTWPDRELAERFRIDEALECITAVVRIGGER